MTPSQVYDGTVEQRMLISLEIEGTDLGIWDSWNGGDKDTASVKYRPGGSPDEQSLGGGNTFTDLTIGRNYRLSRDRQIEAFLLKHTGTGRCTAQRQMLDRAYKAFGKPVVVKGTLKTYTPPNADSNAGNAAMITVVIEPSSVAA